MKQFIFGIPKDGEMSDREFYKFMEMTSSNLNFDSIPSFIEGIKLSGKQFVSLNPLVFNYLEDSDVTKLAVRLGQQEFGVEHPEFAAVFTHKLRALGPGEVLLDTDWAFLTATPAQTRSL